jgi:hypothetical protein
MRRRNTDIRKKHRDCIEHIFYKLIKPYCTATKFIVTQILPSSGSGFFKVTITLKLTHYPSIEVGIKCDVIK